MSGFSADWLALREPFDRVARAAAALDTVREALDRRRAPGAAMRVVDLGAGTGANLRYAAPWLGGTQEWLLIDDDPELLGMATAACRTQTLELNLATQLPLVPLAQCSLVTASALLDLVSAPWLEELAQRVAEAEAVAWFALSYDGRIEHAPADPLDAEATELVNRHQRTDKGFGAALGPAAAAYAKQLFTAHGFQVHVVASDWQVGAEHSAMQHALLDGWYHAAVAMAPARAAALAAWRGRRREHIAAARSTVRVGHVDLVAIPAARRV